MTEIIHRLKEDMQKYTYKRFVEGVYLGIKISEENIRICAYCLEYNKIVYLNKWEIMECETERVNHTYHQYVCKKCGGYQTRYDKSKYLPRVYPLTCQTEHPKIWKAFIKKEMAKTGNDFVVVDCEACGCDDHFDDCDVCNNTRKIRITKISEE